MQLRQDGGYGVMMYALTDCKTMFAAVANEYIKMPTDKSTLHHAQWIRHLIDKKIMIFHWTDSRDMLADGLAKGNVTRDLLRATMQGKWIIRYKPLRFPENGS